MATASSDTTDLRETTAFEDLLTPDILSSLMRSTWTWDDRALRRDLSALLVGLSAARHRRQADAVSETLQARALNNGAQFVAEVMGPALVADTGNPFRSAFVDAAMNSGRFAQRANTALAQVATEAHSRMEDICATTYAPQTRWQTLTADSGRAGLAEAMRSFGNIRSASSYFASYALAWQIVDAVGPSSSAAHLAERLRTGSLIATFAAAESSGSWDPALVRTRAVSGGDRWELTGTKYFVPSVDCAEIIFVIARSVAGPSLFAVKAADPAVTVRSQAVIDPSRPLAEVDFNGAPAELLGVEGGGGQLMSRGMELAVTALAGEQVGLIEGAIAKVRGHRNDRGTWDEQGAARMILDHATATALWNHAVAAGTADAAYAAHVGCSAAAVDAATVVAEICGPDEESTAILQRALSGGLLFGGPAIAHERLLESLGI